MLRILLVGAGASFSIKDVEDGYLTALRASPGVEIKYYALDARLQLARSWLRSLWRARGKLPNEKPGWADAIYRASIEALEMALRFEVDWVVIVSGMFFHPDALECLRRAGKKTAVLLTESPYDDAQQARLASLADVCWTTERTSVRALYAANRQVRYLRHAYIPARHQPVPTTDASDLPEHGVLFVGTGFAERVRLLEAVDWSGIDLGLYGEWPWMGSRHRLRQYVRDRAIDNTTTAALYRRATIGLNLYRASDGAESMNPRAYELAACGVFQISQARAELTETLGEAVPTFSTPAELETLVRRYLNHSSERHRLARLARHRIEPHTFASRAAKLIADLDAFDDRALARGA